MKIEQFFGLSIPPHQFDLDAILKKTTLFEDIQHSNTVKKYIKEAGAHNKIISIAKRQLFLKAVTSLIEGDIQKYDALWYTKDVNTAEEQDRLYEAEEKLLIASLCIATAQPANKVQDEQFKPSIKNLRDMKPNERMQKIWALLHQNTEDDIVKYQKDAKQRSEEKEADATQPEDSSGNKFTKWVSNLF